MSNFLSIYKAKGITDMLQVIEEAFLESNKKIDSLEKKIDEMQTQYELMSALIVGEGSSIAPITLPNKFKWIADDLGDMVIGLDAISYSPNGIPTRWAIKGGGEIRFIAPISRAQDVLFNIRVNGNVSTEIIKTVRVFADTHRIQVSVNKNEGEYLVTGKLGKVKTSKPSIIVIKFLEKIDGETRHTLGLNQLELVGVSNE